MEKIIFKRFKVKEYWDNIGTGYNVIQDDVIIGYILPIGVFSPRPKPYYLRNEKILAQPNFVVVIPDARIGKYRCYSFRTLKNAKKFIFKKRNINNFSWKELPEKNDEVYLGHLEI